MNSEYLYPSEEHPDIEVRMYGNDVPMSGHKMFSVFTSEGWKGPLCNGAWPVLMAAFILLFIAIFHRALNKLFDTWFKDYVIGDFDPNEEIADYWKSLDMHDLGWTYHEEMQARKIFDIYEEGQGANVKDKFSLFDDHSFKKLSEEYKRRNDVEKRMDEGEPGLNLDPKSAIQGTHSYDILANPNYFDDFIYIPVYQPLDYDATPDFGNQEMKEKRQHYIIDDDDDSDNDDWVCDKVRVGLNFAYLHKDVATDFVFSANSLKKGKKVGKGKGDMEN